MSRTLIIALIAGIAFLLFGIYLLLPKSAADPTNSEIPADWFSSPSDITRQQVVTVLPRSIQSLTGQQYSAEQLLAAEATVSVTNEGLYRNSSDETQYDIFYFEPNGHLSIQLYQEPLLLARTLAESQLKNTLPYSEEEFCDMGIQVMVSRYVSEEYKDRDLRLSFCEGSVPLE